MGYILRFRDDLEGFGRFGSLYHFEYTKNMNAATYNGTMDEVDMLGRMVREEASSSYQYRNPLFQTLPEETKEQSRASEVASEDDFSASVAKAIAASGSIQAYAKTIYTDIDVAKDEVWKRWNDADLKKEVSKFLGGDMPDFFRKSPKAYLARSIASPNREAVQFLKIAHQLALQPVFGEYPEDKFTSNNFDKYHLGKLFFYDGKGRNNGEKLTSKSILDIRNADGRMVDELTTVWGESLASFHRRMFHEVMPRSVTAQRSIMDVSPYLKHYGESARRYYPKYLAWFLCYGVLAELFMVHSEKDKQFLEDTVVPAFERLQSLFGLKPLILATFPGHDGPDNLAWKYYPESLKKLLQYLD
jgi:hypothetical protein